jgi:hemerythrin-like metal-binding protein
MAEYFAWKEEYKMNIKEIDKQHEYFVSLLNKLYIAIIDFQTQDNLGLILDELIVYAVDHFKTEEKYFDKFHFIGAEEHKKEHQMLKERLLDFKLKFTQDKAKISFELIDFLESWLVDHLDNMDKKYVECFHVNGLK